MARELEISESVAELAQLLPGSCNSRNHCGGLGTSGQGSRSPGVCRWDSSTLARAREMCSHKVTKGDQEPSACDVGVLESVADTEQPWLERHILSNSPRHFWSYWPRKQKFRVLKVRRCNFGHNGCAVWGSVQVQSRGVKAELLVTASLPFKKVWFLCQSSSSRGFLSKRAWYSSRWNSCKI